MHSLLVDVSPHRVAAARCAHQYHHGVQRQYQRCHVGQLQVERCTGRGPGQNARRHDQRRTAAAQSPQPGQRLAARDLTCIAVVCPAVPVVAIQVFFKVIEIGALLLFLAVGHHTIPARS